MNEQIEHLLHVIVDFRKADLSVRAEMDEKTRMGMMRQFYQMPSWSTYEKLKDELDTLVFQIGDQLIAKETDK